MRNSICGFDVRKDVHKLMENAVYLHLLHLDYKIYVGQLSSSKVDFVAEKEGKVVYIQVCYMLTEEATVQREFGNLLKIEDNYPKYVVTMDELSTGNYNGIEQIHLKDFLMKQTL